MIRIRWHVNWRGRSQDAVVASIEEVMDLRIQDEMLVMDVAIAMIIAIRILIRPVGTHGQGRPNRQTEHGQDR